MSSTYRGKQAESAAAEYLQRQGYKIIAMNWRTRYCEIDVIAEKKHAMHFVEVKYRETARQGSGLDYITPKKLASMSFAAEIWVSTHNWSGEYCLSAVEVSGQNYEVTGHVVSV